MQQYAASLTQYKRLKTLEVNVGGVLIGNFNPIRLQTMTTTDTMDTIGTVEQTIRCIEAGAELVRITAPSKKEAENLYHIKKELNRRGYHVPLVADIHFTPNAAEIAARLIEKVRVNPGNYVDKKKFEQIEYTDAAYQEEIDRIRDRFRPLLKICKEYGTAMRIGTNHGSLSDRIMSRYGDTHIGMVESAMEFLRIARDENYHNIVLSMKASNPQVMVQAYRLLTTTMLQEFGECYPLHLGVTEAGDGEDGRVKSAVGMGTLLEDGIGDTVRVSLTEEPELEIPVCRDLVKRYPQATIAYPELGPVDDDVLQYPRTHKTFSISNIGGGQVPVVIADLSKHAELSPQSLSSIGYHYDIVTDKWTINDIAADYIYTAKQELTFSLPGTLKVITSPNIWLHATDKEKYFPIFSIEEYLQSEQRSSVMNFVMIDCRDVIDDQTLAALQRIKADKTAVLCLSSLQSNAMQCIRYMYQTLNKLEINNPTVIIVDSQWRTADEHLIHYATEAGALLLDGMGDGVCFGMDKQAYSNFAQDFNNNETLTGRNYNVNTSIEQFINTTAFSILQATRTRISKTEYISCPSCGRTLFDLQETTAMIRSKTNHLKGVKIAIMGCIVNGPGEMADADFGYVGSGVGKITLYKGKEVVKKGIDSEIAVDELINLLKENNVWVEPV
jgi:(E)-4-hydroxy-3-methylbut-2-enyl-diphosphate synthase